MPAARLHVDGNIRPADPLGDFLFEMIGNLVGFLDRQVFADREMEVNQLLGSGPAGAEIVVAEQFVLVIFNQCLQLGLDFRGQLFVEDIAKTVWLAMQIGQVQDLPADEIAANYERYQHRYGTALASVAG